MSRALENQGKFSTFGAGEYENDDQMQVNEHVVLQEATESIQTR